MDDSLIEFIPHKKEEKYSYCVDCGEKIAYSSIRCKSCNGRYVGKQISTELPVTRGELKDLIRNKPFTTIANTSGNTWHITTIVTLAIIKAKPLSLTSNFFSPIMY